MGLLERVEALHLRRYFPRRWSQKGSVRANPLFVRHPSIKVEVVSKTLRLFPNTGSPCPTFQCPPYIVSEPRLFHSLRPLRAFALNHVSENDQVRIPVKWDMPTENFIYHHSQCVTIGMSRWAAVFGAELLGAEEFQTHPSERATLHK